MSLACGGKMDETRTRFCAAIPASRRANSKEVRRSLFLPTPLVKNSRFGTMLFPNSCSSAERALCLQFDAGKMIRHLWAYFDCRVGFVVSHPFANYAKGWGTRFRAAV